MTRCRARPEGDGAGSGRSCIRVHTQHVSLITEMGLMMVPGGEEMTPEQITAFKEDVLTKVGEAVQPLFDIIFTLWELIWQLLDVF